MQRTILQCSYDYACLGPEADKTCHQQYSEFNLAVYLEMIMQGKESADQQPGGQRYLGGHADICKKYPLGSYDQI